MGRNSSWYTTFSRAFTDSSQKCRDSLLQKALHLMGFLSNLYSFEIYYFQGAYSRNMPQVLVKCVDDLVKMLEQNQIHPHVSRVFPLSEVCHKNEFEILEVGKQAGKQYCFFVCPPSGNMARKQCLLVCPPSGNMARKQCFLVCPPSRNMARKQCFLVCPPSGNMARKQCFLVCPPSGNMARKQCFLVCPPSGNMARKQCFLVCPPSGNMARKQCFLVCPPS